MKKYAHLKLKVLKENFKYAPAATSNSPTCGQVKIPHLRGEMVDVYAS